MIALVLMVLSISQVKAQYVLASDGYYYNGGQAYTRISTWVEGYYYRSGCGYAYYPGYYTYSYTPYYAPKLAYGPGWKERLITAGEQLADHNAYQQAFSEYMSKVGYQPTSLISLRGYNNGVYGNFGLNTSTLYGFNVLPTGLSQYAGTQYLQIDPEKQLLTFQQTVNDSGSAFFGALKDTGGLVDRAITGQQLNQDREARRRLVSNAFADYLRSVDPPVQTTSSLKFTRSATTGGAAALPPIPPVAPTVEGNHKSLQDRFNLTASRCADCHYGDKKEGNWTLTDLSNPNILDRLIRPMTDPKHMPKGGQVVTIEELQTWREAIASDAASKMKPEMPKLNK